MTAQPYRSAASDPREYVLHQLHPLGFADQSIALRLGVRRSNDGAWRGRLRFSEPGGRELETAEIFCGTTEDELWQRVWSLGEHHVRALYQSLA